MNMKQYKFKNDKGFTLLEVMIVLFIISILLLVGIPNVAKEKEIISKKGCQAMIRTTEAQLQAYEMEKGAPPTSIVDLVQGDYISSSQCPDGKNLVIENGKVIVQE